MIAGVYDVPLEAEDMPDTGQVVADILGQHYWLFTIDASGYTLDPHSMRW